MSGWGRRNYWFQIPNWIDDRPVKLHADPNYSPDIRLSLLWNQSVVRFQIPRESRRFEDSETTIPLDPLNGLVHRTEQWRIFPNPDNEWLIMDVPPDMAITQVVIDTWSVPEPTSLLLAVLAFLGLSLRR